MLQVTKIRGPPEKYLCSVANVGVVVAGARAGALDYDGVHCCEITRSLPRLLQHAGLSVLSRGRPCAASGRCSAAQLGLVQQLGNVDVDCLTDYLPGAPYASSLSHMPPFPLAVVTHYGRC